MSPHSNRSKNKALPGREPRPEELRKYREAAGLTQQQAADVIYTSVRNQQNWEQGNDSGGTVRRSMPASAFELFMLKTGQFTFERLVVLEEGVSRLELRLSNGAVIGLTMPAPALGSLASGIGAIVR